MPRDMQMEMAKKKWCVDKIGGGVTLNGWAIFLNGLVGSVINEGDVSVLLQSPHAFEKKVSKRFKFFMVGICVGAR
jgi:hypothetical protein